MLKSILMQWLYVAGCGVRVQRMATREQRLAAERYVRFFMLCHDEAPVS